MRSDTETEKKYMTRDAILGLLSDDEIAKVSLAESRPPVEGEHYVDLQRPESGVLTLLAGVPIRGASILPRSAVRDETWSAIVAQLGR